MASKQKAKDNKSTGSVKKKNDSISLKTLLPYVLLAVFTFALYAQTLTFDFVHHDDDVMILDNTTTLEQFDFKTIFLTDAWFKPQNIELYRPWQSFTYYLDYQIWGTNATGYHLHNLLVFIAGILCIYSFLKRLGFNQQWQLGLSVLYASHYLFAHTVGWIPARVDLYLTFFGVLTANLLIDALSGKGKWWLVMLLFFIALMAKETAIVIVPSILLLQWALKGFETNYWKQLPWWQISAFALPAGIYFAFRYNSIYHSPFLGASSIAYNLPQIPELIFKFFVPLRFTVLPHYDTTYAIAGTVVLFLLGLAISLLNTEKRNLATGGVFMFLLAILPSLAYKPNFSGFAYDYLDHRMFFASVGLLVLTGSLLSAFAEKIKANPFVVTGVPSLLMAGLSLWHQPDYKDFHHYYQSAIKSNPKSGLAYLNYALLLRNKEAKYETALNLLNKAIEIYPDSIVLYKEKATNYFVQGKLDSLSGIVNTLQRMPNGAASVHFYKGLLFAKNQMNDSAIAEFTACIAVDPNTAENFYNRGKLYREKGMMNEAINDFNRALQLMPNYTMALHERGNALGNMGYFREALADYTLYVTLKPDDASGHFYKAQALVLTGNRNAGCEEFTIAAKMGLKDAEAKLNEFCR